MGNKQSESDRLLDATPSSVVTVHPPNDEQRALYSTRRRAIILVFHFPSLLHSMFTFVCLSCGGHSVLTPSVR
jgi:hypothetical protein